ncbi:MAG: adenylyl-sulfate kinase [Candidatus Neomarinimicrobiota bacterium]|nr:adenylyl-sulfate kinase [Candidatus Neomarinimicrobiota bacterium]
MVSDKTLTPGNKHQEGVAVWLTGLSGAGKTTISIPLCEKLESMGYRVQRLDGDVVRQKLTRDLGFSKEDRDLNIERVTFVAERLVKHGVITVCAFISPYRAERKYARDEIGRFVEVFVKCPLEVCEKRDVKGLYAKARAGEIKNFTGIDDPYEEPENAELIVNTSESTLQVEVDAIISCMQENDYIN